MNVKQRKLIKNTSYIYSRTIYNNDVMAMFQWYLEICYNNTICFGIIHVFVLNFFMLSHEFIQNKRKILLLLIQTVRLKFLQINRQKCCVHLTLHRFCSLTKHAGSKQFCDVIFYFWRKKKKFWHHNTHIQKRQEEKGEKSTQNQCL